MQLNGKIAIVTGASSGIGAEFSKALTSKGCHVYGIARRAEKLESQKFELGKLFNPVILDVNDHKEIEHWVEKTFSSSHKPDILINNAGLGLFGAVDEIPPKDWDTMINTNLTSVFRLTRMVVPFMKSNDAATHIVNIASVAGLIGNPNLSGYNASKFGIRGFSEALMKELRNDKIKVTCIYPGSVATEFFDDHGGTHSNMLQGKDVADTLIHILETPDNFLIDEITLRPLIPKPSGK